MLVRDDRREMAFTMSYASRDGCEVVSFGYSVHGATLVSEFECPELTPANGADAAAAAVLRIAERDPPRVRGPLFSGARCWSTATDFRVEVDGVATYYVREGKEVIVHRLRRALMRDVCTFLYDAAFPALSVQAGMIPLRGSAVEVGGRATLIVGQSGAGKSTLAARLVGAGHRLIGDGVICLAEDGRGRPVVRPGISSLQLWRDAIELLGGSPARYTRVRRQLDRFFVPVRRAQVCSASVQVERVCVLNLWNGERASVSALSRLEGTGRIMEHAAQFRLFGGARDMVFERCAALAAGTEILELKRPAGGNTLEAFGPLGVGERTR